MIITKLEATDKRKVKVYIDEVYHFFLYQQEVKRLQLDVNQNISYEYYKDILENIVIKGAKIKALNILKYMDRTEQELVLKLKQAYYTDQIIAIIVEYLKSYHYLDDERYARHYIESKRTNKSKKKIMYDLIQKGINKDRIEQTLSFCYGNEETAIEKEISKKTKNCSMISREEKAKLSSYLYRKGYSFELINKYLNNEYMD